MNFYDFHIGDYASRTAHLEPMEDLAYRRLLDLYYVREGALPLNVAEVTRLIRLKGQDETIRAVLAEFFIETAAGWTHERCEEVVAAAVDKRTKAQASAALRWQNERNANALQAQSKGNAPSPSPSPTTQKKDSAVALLVSAGVPEDMASDFMALRKVKKAPMTATALKRLRSEAEKAGMTLQKAIETCCGRGWAGFEAKWLIDGQDVRAITVPGKQGPDPALVKLKADAAAGTPMPPHIREHAAAIRKGAH